MQVSELTIKKRVRIILDEIGVNDANFVTDMDNVNIDTIAISKVSEAIRTIYEICSPRLITLSNNLKDMEITNNVAKIQLQQKFIRLVSVKLASWPYPISASISQFDAEYQKQHNKLACGTYQRPVVAYVLNPNGGALLELYSAKDENDTIEHGMVLFEPEWTTAENLQYIEIQERLAEAIMYQIAALVLITFKDANNAEQLFAISKQLSQ